MADLDRHVALVTGAARGQGRSHAVQLARAGADVAVLDLCDQITTVPFPLATREDLQETVDLIRNEGRRALPVTVDVRDADAMVAAVEQAVTELGSLDAVVANAGIIAPLGHAWEVPVEAFRDVVDVNLLGVNNTLRAAATTMVATGTAGAMVVTGSGASTKAIANLAPYVAAKHGVVGLALTYARELAPHGIRVNLVHPGNVGTPMLMNDYMAGAFAPGTERPTFNDLAESAATSVPLGIPWVQPEDISAAVVWLLSDAARYVTGAALQVAAGQSIP